jgi:nitrate/TMAO reductase-like tetraheme cytochrome c subunit
LKNAVYLSWKNYDPATDSGEIYFECPTCEIVENFSTMTAANAFERAHLNSLGHIR